MPSRFAGVPGLLQLTHRDIVMFSLGCAYERAIIQGAQMAESESTGTRHKQKGPLGYRATDKVPQYLEKANFEPELGSTAYAREKLELLQMPGQGEIEKATTPPCAVVHLNRPVTSGEPGELFWTAGRTVAVMSKGSHLVRIEVDGLRCKVPFLVSVGNQYSWLLTVGQCFEAQVNVESERAEGLCIFNPRPLGSPDETPERLWDRLQELAHRNETRDD